MHTITRRSMQSIALAAGLILVTVSRPAHAASSARLQPDPYRVEALAPGVFAVIRKTPTNGASDSNVLFVINEKDVVVVDANIYPTSAIQTIREIRKRTTKPVRYLINTHGHSDHHYGNNEYAKAYPGVEIISHPASREMIMNEDIPALEKNLSTEYPAEIKRLEGMLASGKEANGTTLSAEARTRAEQDLAVTRYFVRDTRGIKLLPATMTVADSLVLHRGERSIVIKCLGRGNTQGDLIVHLPKEGIVATGDLLVSPVPFGFGSWPAAWANTLGKLRAIEAKFIMPGHGDMMTNWSYADALIPMLQSVSEQARKAMANGADLAAVRKAVDLTAFRDRFGGSDDRAHRVFAGMFGIPIVEGAFNEIRGDSVRRE